MIATPARADADRPRRLVWRGGRAARRLFARCKGARRGGASSLLLSLSAHSLCCSPPPNTRPATNNLTGGRHIVQYKKKQVKHPRCAVSGVVLQGVSRHGLPGCAAAPRRIPARGRSGGGTRGRPNPSSLLRPRPASVPGHTHTRACCRRRTHSPTQNPPQQPQNHEQTAPRAPPGRAQQQAPVAPPQVGVARVRRSAVALGRARAHRARLPDRGAEDRQAGAFFCRLFLPSGRLAAPPPPRPPARLSPAPHLKKAALAARRLVLTRRPGLKRRVPERATRPPPAGRRSAAPPTNLCSSPVPSRPAARRFFPPPSALAGLRGGLRSFERGECGGPGPFTRRGKSLPPSSVCARSRLSLSLQTLTRNKQTNRSSSCRRPRRPRRARSEKWASPTFHKMHP